MSIGRDLGLSSHSCDVAVLRGQKNILFACLNVFMLSFKKQVILCH